MAKALAPITEKVLQVIRKRFKKGVVLAYDAIADEAGISRETARRHSGLLRAKRLVSIKDGHIVGVK